MVRNTNGKKMRKLVFTAAGLPVFRAMAYGEAGVDQAPQGAQQDERHRAAESGLEAHAGDEPQRQHREGEPDGERQVGHHAAEQEGPAVDRAEQQPVEVPALDVEHEGGGPRDPVTPKMTATGSWKAR